MTGISVITWFVAVAVGVLANFLVFFWLIKFLPRTKVPLKSAVQGALMGAIAFEVIKQLASVLASNALGNPAGATFGPIIGIMVVLYLIWRLLMYCSAWAATSEESLLITPIPAPEPAVIRVRNEIAPEAPPTETARNLGIGVAMGALGSDAAIEAADVVLMDDDPMKIVPALQIAKKCMAIVYQNIVFSIGIKAGVMIFAALGIANMVSETIGMVAIFAARNYSLKNIVLTGNLTENTPR